MSVKIYRFETAPSELKALSDHGGDENYVIVGDVYDHDPTYSADFHYVVETMDVYDHGAGTIHRTTHECRPVDVYIIAHS